MSLFNELKRRNVIRVGIAYCVVGWIAAQVAEFAFGNFGAPPWVLQSFVVALLLGLPLALLFAWAFELTPDGIRREKHVAREASITSQTGRKLDRMIIGVLVIALAWFTWDKFLAGPAPERHAAADPPAPQGETPPPNPFPDLSDKSVAVLPFVAMSSGPDDEYFADGLTEEILNSLAQLPELLVTARTSAFSFKGEDIPVQDIARALGVRHIVEGSVRRSGDRLRVTAQLIRAEDAFHVWSENYDSTSTDTIAVQEDIAEKIADALDVVLDQKKREVMRQAGLRDVEAFTLYQKGLDLFARAHGEIETIDGLRRANAYFDQVILRVPEFSPVYVDHSDFYVHLLNAASAGEDLAGVSTDELDGAFASAIADYEAAVGYASNPEWRRFTELDLAFISGNWRGLGGRIQHVLGQPDCREGNWTPIMAIGFGYAKEHLAQAKRILTCDPRRSLSWFDAVRAAIQAGLPAEALALAREGNEIAPGGWLGTELVRALVANGLHEEALVSIDGHIREADVAEEFRLLVAAHQGDEAGFSERYAGFSREQGDWWHLIVAAWGGRRDDANRFATRIDQHPFGPVSLVQVSVWCACGAPWDLEATPNFAAALEGSGLRWPAPAVMDFPLKDW